MIEFRAYLNNDAEPQAEWNPDLSGACAVPRVSIIETGPETPLRSGFCPGNTRRQIEITRRVCHGKST